MSEMREAINAALDGNPDEDYEETPQEVHGAEDTDDADTGDTGASEGEAADEANANPDAADQGEGGKSPEENAAADQQAPAGESDKPAKELAAGDSIKAPIDWGPEEREQWSKIPRNLQEKVMARETELSTLLSTTADARRTHQEFGQLVQTYGSALSGVAGNTPMETVNNLFSTVANLRMGSPIQKAQIIADMISDFGVDVHTLDSAIVGAAPSPDQQHNHDVERLVSERMAPFEKMMGQQSAYQNQQHEQRQETANTEVTEFAKTAEFLGDVRNQMADLIDVAGKNGRELTMQEAYDTACTLNPQVKAVIDQRAEVARLTGGKNLMDGKRQAASGLSGRQVGIGGGAGDTTMRDTIAAAWDSQGKI